MPEGKTPEQKIARLEVRVNESGNAVLIGEDDWRAIQETLLLESVPGLAESIRRARDEGIAAGSTDLDW